MLKLKKTNPSKIGGIILLFFVSSITIFAVKGNSMGNSPLITRTYKSSSKSFPNPERGFFLFGNLIDDRYGTEVFSSLNKSYLQQARNQGVTLIHRYYLISEFREKPISQSFLHMLSNDFRVARQSGIKLIPRFTYNYLSGAPDASKNIILSHIEQLKPILTKNFDVIAYVEAGFIGTWGEWHGSSHNLDVNSQDRKDILFKLLSVLPQSRMVALRYAHYKREIFNNKSPLSNKDAFKGTYRARVGAHNDCFLTSIDDRGTYNSTNPQLIEAQKIFLSLDNQYVVQGGEVCLPEKRYENINCSNALSELSRMRWSTLSAEPDDGKETLKKWEKQGCIEEIKQRLGYRFRLLRSHLTKSVKQCDFFPMRLEIINDGWASPYNPRKVEIILKERQKQIEYYLPINEDPRTWMSEKIQTLEILGGVPCNMPAETYEVLLNLPDTSPTLYRNPKYSIRLANENIWHQATGYNSLLAKIVVQKTDEIKTFSKKKNLFRLRRNR